MSTRDEDVIDKILVTNSHDYLLCFAASGKVHKIKALQIPEGSRQSKGVSINHFLELAENDKVTLSRLNLLIMIQIIWLW